MAQTRKPLTLLFAGFGFTPKHIAAHAKLYRGLGGTTIDINLSVLDLTRPSGGPKHGTAIVDRLREADPTGTRPLTAHVISGSYWMFLYTLLAMTPEERSRFVGLFFDSTPPTSGVDAFGGWAAFALGRPQWKPYLSPLFHGYRAAVGITPTWEKEAAGWALGPEACVPRHVPVTYLRCKDDPVVCPEHHQRAVLDTFQNSDPGVPVRSVTLTGRHALGIKDSPTAYCAAFMDYYNDLHHLLPLEE